MSARKNTSPKPKKTRYLEEELELHGFPIAHEFSQGEDGGEIDDDGGGDGRPGGERGVLWVVGRDPFGEVVREVLLNQVSQVGDHGRHEEDEEEGLSLIHI